MTKQAQLKQCRQLLVKYANTSTPTVTSTDDFHFLLSIFEQHPNWEEKKGSGIQEIQVGRTPWNSSCFYILRTDSSKTDISFVKSITKPNPITNIKRACRAAVKYTIINFKAQEFAKQFSIICPLTNLVLTPDTAHVDHYDLTFDQVVTNWLKRHDIKKVEKALRPSADLQFAPFFTDSALSENFREYHDKNTHLRLIQDKANLTLPKK